MGKGPQSSSSSQELMGTGSGDLSVIVHNYVNSVFICAVSSMNSLIVA